MTANDDGQAIPAEGLRVLDEDHAHGLRADPRIPSRAELDAAYERGEARGWDEQTARAWEYLDSRREIADERAAATERGDTATIDQLDRRHAALELNYLGLAREHPTQATPAAAAATSEAPVEGVPQDPGGERPSAPDDLDALRARVAGLRSQRTTVGPDQQWHGQTGFRRQDGAGEEQARRAQLAAWAEDDTRRDTPTAGAGWLGTSDEDGS